MPEGNPNQPNIIQRIADGVINALSAFSRLFQRSSK